MFKVGVNMYSKKDYLVNNEYLEGLGDDLRIEVISEDHLKDVVELNELVYDQLPDKEILYLDSYETMLEDLNKGALLIGLYNDENKLVAYRYSSFPGLEDRNLAYDFEFPVDLMKVCQFETTIIREDYRGRSLQDRMLKVSKAIANDKGYTDFTTTVSPYNYHSLYNMMNNHLKIMALKKKYGGLVRFILHGKMDSYDYGTEVDTVNVHMENIEKQKELLKKDYIGYTLNEDKTIDYVKFE